MSMPLLDAALAFCLTMLLTATVVSQASGLLMGLFKQKAAGFKKMLETFATQNLKPIVMRHISSLEEDAQKQIESKLTSLTRQFKISDLFSEDEIKHAVKTSSDEIIEKIKQTDLGTELISVMGEKSDALFQDLAQRYNQLCERFTEFYRNHARWWTTIVALVIAGVINIDSVRVANSYIQQQSVSEGAVARMGAIMTNYEAAAQNPANTNSLDELHAAVQKSQSQIDTLAKSGVPIGWQYYPYGSIGAPETTGESGAKTLLMWFVGVLLTAMLAGLGAPFWYDTVKGVASFSQSLRSLKQTGSTSGASDSKPAPARST